MCQCAQFAINHAPLEKSAKVGKISRTSFPPSFTSSSSTSLTASAAASFPLQSIESTGQRAIMKINFPPLLLLLLLQLDRNFSLFSGFNWCIVCVCVLLVSVDFCQLAQMAQKSPSDLFYFESN